MVAFAMDVLESSVGFCVGLAEVLSKVECDIQNLNDLFVGVDGNAHSVVFEYGADFFFDVFCCSREGVCDS